MAHILIVEDEPGMRLGLTDNLEFEGYTVDTAKDGEEGLEKIIKETYDLILLDVMMPKLSGLDVCKQIRKQGINTPVIFLTAKGEEIDKVLGLELGADDYITKPFGLRELLARIKAVLRRKDGASASDSFVAIGRLSVNFAAFTAFENAEPIPLSHKEFEILHLLWRERNRTVSRDQLLTEVWGYDESPSTRTVDNFIMKLRRSVEPDSNHPRIILTVHSIGYKLVSS